VAALVDSTKWQGDKTVHDEVHKQWMVVLCGSKSHESASWSYRMSEREAHAKEPAALED